MDQTPRSEAPAMTAHLTGTAKSSALLAARYAVDFPAMASARSALENARSLGRRHG